MPSLQQFNYQPPKTQPIVSDDAPTMTQLMGEKDKSKWVSVTVPKETAVFDIAFEPIQLNTLPAFQPGETYKLPKLIAEELKVAIKNFEDSIIIQMSKKATGKKAGVAAGVEDGEFTSDGILATA